MVVNFLEEHFSLVLLLEPFLLLSSLSLLPLVAFNPVLFLLFKSFVVIHGLRSFVLVDRGAFDLFFSGLVQKKFREYYRVFNWLGSNHWVFWR